MIKRILFPLVFCLGLIGGSLSAQENRSVKASQSIQDFRVPGEIRVWSFFAQNQTFGRLTSTVKGRTSVDGVDGLIFDEHLQIDYTRLNQDRQVDVKSELSLANTGFYLGNRTVFGPEDAADRLDLRRDGNRLKGSYTRGGRKFDHTVEYPVKRLAWEPNFVDQLEVWLAMQDLTVGDTLVDTLWSPHTMIETKVAGKIFHWMWQEIYKGKIDSVFIIRLYEPQDYQLYFTKDKKLLRVDFINQNMRVFQDVIIPPKGTAAAATDSQVKPAAPVKPEISARRLFLKSPHYVAFVVIAGLGLLFLARRGFRWLDAYIHLVAGAALGVLMLPFVQVPIQEWVVQSVVIPKITGGESLFVWGMLPALIAAAIQMAAVFGGLYAVLAWRNPKDYRIPALGAFLGAGFALTEAFWVSGLVIHQLITWALLERACFILFHVASGFLLGRAIKVGGQQRMVGTAVGLLLANGLLRYAPVLVQGQVVDVELMHFLMVFAVLLVLGICILQPKEGREPAKIVEE
ncbi:MAG: hypothetical protein KKA42_01785 [candidate division Zixibacteria bacterium]|nr:hypothetical protein [candidate division Zixibacteria bacterium]